MLKEKYNCIRVISMSGDFACSVLVSAPKMNVQSFEKTLLLGIMPNQSILDVLVCQ